MIHTISRFFYKYRGVEKIAEGQNVGRVLLLAERFSGTAAFAHGLAFCQAIEAICGTKVPARARALRTVLPGFGAIARAPLPARQPCWRLR